MNPVPPGAAAPEPDGRPGGPPPDAGVSQTSGLIVEAVARQVVGPLPPPSYLRGYEELDPGRAAKLFDLAEDQSRHRMRMEERALAHQNARSWGGLAAASVIAPFTIGAGVYVAVSGHPAAGATIATATVVGLVGAFVYGSQSLRAERVRKAEIMTGRPDRDAAGG